MESKKFSFKMKQIQMPPWMEKTMAVLKVIGKWIYGSAAC